MREDLRKTIKQENLTDIHGPFYAAEVYSGEKIKAYVTVRDSIKNSTVEAKVWKLSPLGIEISIEHKEGYESGLREGAEIDLTVMIAKQRCDFFGTIVCTLRKVEGNVFIGVRWCQDKRSGLATSEGRVDRRSSRRWICGEAFLPSGVSPNPTRFGDFIHFRVRDISKTGLRLITSLRNRYLIPGMSLDAHISFPLFGLVDQKIKIIDASIVNINGSDQLSLGAQMTSVHNDALHIIANYVMQFSPSIDVEDLHREQMYPKKVSDKLQYSYVSSKEEYDEVLKLRHLAYKAAGKVDPNSEYSSMGDMYDTRARIIIARHHGEIVGSVRVMFHEPEDSLELEQFVQLPSRFPRKDESVEVTRFCVHPKFQGSDLLFGLMKQLFLVMTQTHRKWIISFASKDMIKKFYLKFGAELTDVQFKHTQLNNIDQHVFLFDIEKVIKGISVGPIIWNLLLEDVYDYLHDHEYYEVDPISSARVAFYRLFKPAAAVFKNNWFKWNVLKEPK